MPFTDTAIRALKPKATRYSRTDERGLVLEVFPTGGSELVMPGRGSLTKPFAHNVRISGHRSRPFQENVASVSAGT